MKYRRFEDTIIARFDPGEEILEQVKELALREEIRLASVQALGAVGELTVGVYKTDVKEYLAREYRGRFEIASLIGTINTMDGAFYCHLHVSAADDQGTICAGHLNRAVVSATCEMVIRVIHGTVDRYHDDDIGLNLLDL